jgi:hypothetical protein
MTFYVVNWDPSMFEELPDMLIEAEAVAVFDG